MADESDSDKKNTDSESDEAQVSDETGADPTPDATGDSANSDEGGVEDGVETDAETVSENGEAVDDDTVVEDVVASNIVPIDVFEPLGRYQTYLKVLSTCVTELADEAAAELGNYLRRPVTLSMGDIRVIGQANCQPENSLLNGGRDFFRANLFDGYFYVGLSNELIAYICLLYTSPSPRDRG